MEQIGKYNGLFFGILLCAPIFLNAQKLGFKLFERQYEQISGDSFPNDIEFSWVTTEPQFRGLGFDFNWNNEIISELEIWYQGHFNMIDYCNNESLGIYNSLSFNAFFNFDYIDRFWLINSSNKLESSIETTTLGQAPNRVFVVQYNNVGVDCSECDSTTFFNMQYRFYEEGNLFEFHVGEHNIKEEMCEFGFPRVILNYDSYCTLDSSELIILSLGGNPNEPTLYNIVDDTILLKGYPDPNTVYQFKFDSTVAVKPLSAESIVISQTGSNQILVKSLTASSVIEVYDLQGKILYIEEVHTPQVNIQIPYSGLVIVRVSTQNQSEQAKFILQK